MRKPPKVALHMVRFRDYELVILDAARQVTGDPSRSEYCHRVALEEARRVLEAEEARLRAADGQPDGNNAGS
jgi:hypothetical protein